MQRAINQFASLNTPRAVLHDEFRRIDAAEWQKRVWVQNSGNSPFIARISASEFMQWVESEDWTRGRNIIEGIPFADPIPAAIETTLTPTLDSDTWGADGTLIDTQTAWFNVTADMWSIRGLTDLASLTQAAPARGHAADGEPFSQYWDWTQPHLLTYAQWQTNHTTNPSSNLDKWVLADDGYFYYTSVIRPETNTLPLMTGVSAASGFDPLKHAFYYAIDIQMEVVTQEDVGAMKDGLVPSSGTDGVPLRAASTQGKAILDSINWNLTPPIGGFSITINGISEDVSNTDRLIEVVQNDTVTFEVNAISTGDPLYYQWQLENSWTDISGATNATYSPPTTTAGSENYRVLVSTESDPAERDASNTTISAVITLEVEALPIDPLAPQSAVGTIPVRTNIPNSHAVNPPHRVLFDGVPFWRIASATHEGKTYYLIVTQYLYSHGTPFNPTTADGNFWLSRTGSASTKSSLMTAMDAWYNARGPQLKAAAVFPAFTGTINQTTPTSSTFGTEGITGMPTQATWITGNNWFTANSNRYVNGQSRPSAVLVGSASANTQPLTGGGIVAFPLSGTEILAYFPDSQAAASGSGNANAGTSDGRLGRSATNPDGSAGHHWWARTRGSGALMAGGVYSLGMAYFGFGGLSNTGIWGSNAESVHNVGSTDIAHRPALWVVMP
ncbi:MAG: hypothetical protein FWG78_04950 [Coriobacteriia bacterium]|nr:hypothetical protein [Coriobacteriia bacterium]